MNPRSKSKIARFGEVLAFCLIPLLCIGGVCSMALLTERPHNSASLPRARHYDLARFLSDAHQVAAVLDYLTQIDAPVTPQRVAKNSSALPHPQPLLSQSNYTLVLVTNRADPI